MKKISIIIIVEVFFCLSTNSQKPVLEWAARFHNQASYSLDADGLGNIFICGVYYDVRIPGTKYLTLKYNSSGSLQWYRLYHGPDNIGGYSNIAYKNIADGAGNVYVAGMSSSWLGHDDILIIKYNSEGDNMDCEI